jgi:hypothetical protein
MLPRMRYILDVPKSDNEMLVSVAEDEGIPPRMLVVWLLRFELARRLKQIRERTETGRVA